MKPTKRGFKVWVLACANTGYMLDFKIYEGRENNPTAGTLGERTVLNLSEPFQRKGYCLCFDNIFSTFHLLSQLLDKDMFACGTFRTNRKKYPTDLLAQDKTMRLGESDYVQSGDISVTKWRDRGKKSVVVVSSLHNP